MNETGHPDDEPKHPGEPFEERSGEVSPQPFDDEGASLELTEPERADLFDESLELGEPTGRVGHPEGEDHLERADPTGRVLEPTGDYLEIGENPPGGLILDDLGGGDEWAVIQPTGESPYEIDPDVPEVVSPAAIFRAPATSTIASSPASPPRRSPLPLLAATAAVLVAGVVPSYLIYQDQQAKLTAAASEAAQARDAQTQAIKKMKADGDAATRKQEADALARKEAEAMMAEAIEKQKVEATAKTAADARVEDALAKQKAAEDARLAADRAAEKAKADAIAQKAADDRMIAELEKGRRPGTAQSSPGPGPAAPAGPSYTDQVGEAVKLIQGKDTGAAGIAGIVGLRARSKNPKVFDDAIAGLGDSIARPEEAKRLLDAYNAAKSAATDPSLLPVFDLFGNRLGKAISKTQAGGAEGGLGAAARGPARVVLVSRQVDPRKAGLIRSVDDGRDNLAKAPEATIDLETRASMVEDSSTLGEIYLAEKNPADAIRVYDEALGVLKEGQKRLDKLVDPDLLAAREDLAKKLLHAAVGLGEKLDAVRGPATPASPASAPAPSPSPELAMLRGRLTEAQARLADTQSKLTDALGKLAEAQSRLTTTQGELTQAQDKLASALAKPPTPSEALAAVEAQRDQAVRTLREGAFSSYATAIDSFDRRDFVKADRDLTVAIAGYPRDPRFHYFRGIARYLLARDGVADFDRDQAAVDIRQGARLEALHPDGFTEVGHALARLPHEVIEWVESIRRPASPTVTAAR